MKNNTNLVAVQKADYTGKVVTRHVRADPKQTRGTLKVPAPVVAKSSSTKKLTAAQRKQKPHEYSFAQFDRDSGLYDFVQSKLTFTASDAEIYDVLSAVDKPGSAVKILSEGIRSADEARLRMESIGVSQTSTGRSDLTDLALRRGIPPKAFLEHVEVFEEALQKYPNHDPENVIDSVLFSTSKLRERHAGTEEEIREGRISYSDIRTIGAARLTSRNRLKIMQDVLKDLNSGEADYTAEDMKEVIKKAASEDMIDPSLQSVLKMIDLVGVKTVVAAPIMRYVSSAYDHYHQTVKWQSRPDKDERAAYAARVMAAGNDGLSFPTYDEFYDAGIEPGLAARVIERGGTVVEAKAVQDEGINENLAEGWL